MTDITPTPRITPVGPPYDQHLTDTLARWMPPGAAVEPLRLFRTLAVHRELMDRMRPLGAALLSRHSALDRAERELVIERVCARCGCEYEWGVHAAAFGLALLGEEKVRATATATPADPLWSEREGWLLQVVDELHDRAADSDDLWQRLESQWQPNQLLELLVLVGWYHTIAFVANGARVTTESWAPPLPHSTAGDEAAPR
jgi:alkylhydroperoxidase family enzyme